MDCKLSSYKIIPTRLFQTSSFSDVTVEKPITKPISNSNTRCVLSKNLEDLLYVDDVNDEEVIVCLLRRFFRQKYFTYFGKVLFFLQPDRDILSNSSQFLYSDFHNQCHLYSFLKQIFAEFISSDGVCIFFHGDSNGQLHIMNKSLIFLLKLANIQGFQGAEELNVKINDVMKLLEYWTSDSTNLMTSYKINFCENCVKSVNFIPNFATDFSSLSGHVNMKLPSIFYGLIYSISKGKNLHWTTYTLPLQLVKELLNSIPHILDPIQHINNFSQMMNIMMNIGFMIDELREMNKVLLSILIFNYMSRVNTRVGNLMELLDLVCNLLEIGIMKESNTNLKSNDIIFKAEIKKSTPDQFYNIPTALFLRLKHLIYTKINQFLIYQTVEPDKNSTKNGNRNGIVDGVGTNSTKNSNTKSTNDFSTKNSSTLYGTSTKNSNTRYDTSTKNSNTRYDTSTKNSNTRYDSSTVNTNNDENTNEYKLRSIIMYNNCIMDPLDHSDQSGQSGQPNPSDHSDDLNKFIINISEEMLLNKFYKVVEKKFGYPIDSEIVQRNKLLVDNLTGQMGLLTQITSQSIKLYNKQKSHNEQLSNEPIEYNTIEHSWGIEEYNMKKIIEMESKLYILNPIIKLLKYSKNSILKSLLFTNNSLHRFVGNLTFLLSYYSYINSEEYHWYFISCTTKQQYINRDIQQDNRHDIEKLEFDECVNKLYNFYTNHIPILEICNMERNNNKVKYDLEQYTRYNYSLIYKFTNVKLHKTLKQLTNEQIIKLLFKSLNINENMYEIDKNIITIRMTIQIRILTLIEEYNRNHKKVIVIQNWYKTRKYISLKRQLINNFIRIQSLIRMKLINKTIKLQNQAKIITNQFISNCIVQLYIYKWLNNMDNKTLSLLRPIEKRFHELEFEYLQNAAATYIQAVWRGSLQRRKYSIVKKNKFEEFAIILIQSSVRRILSCYSLLDTRNVKYTSCVMIQSYFRGYLVRKKYEKLLSLKLILLPILLKGSKIIGMSEQINFIKLYKDQNSVSLQMKRLISVQTNLPPGFIKVQNLARMHFIRKQFLNLKNTLEKVYAVAMTKCARMEYLEKVRSAVKIQRWWRLLPKDSIPSLGSGALYYINKKEKNTVSLLSNELKEFGITIYSYVCSDLRRIYLNTWAMVPLTLIKTIRLMQKSSTDLNFTQMRSIDTIKFAIGSTHSLILIQTNQGSCVYSWGWNDKGQLGRKSLYPLKSSDNDFLITNPLEFQSTHNNINNNTNSTNTNSISNTNSHNNTNSSVLEMELYRIYNGLEENVYIVDVVCGNDYSLALSDVGIVYSWGDNTYGQCGQGPRYLKIYQPTAIELNGVTSICSASYHSVVFSNFEFYTFGKTFGYNIFRPVLISKLIPSLVNQTLKVVKCAGTVTLFYTNELDYILSVYNTNFSIYSFKSYRLDSTEYIGNGVVNGQDRVGNRLDTVGSTMGVGNTQDTSDSTLNTLNTVNKWDRIKMYSFMGSIKEVSTNGKIICGIIENGTESSYEVKVYIMGYIKCVPMEKKVGTKNLFVGAFREKFENKTKPISLLNVQTDHGMNCYIPSPAEVILHRIPNQVLCDGEQVIFVTNNAIYGAKLFQIHVQNQDDYEVKDNSTVEIRPGANIRLDPVIYQFMEPFNKKNKLHTSFNSLSHSILYSD